MITTFSTSKLLPLLLSPSSELIIATVGVAAEEQRAGGSRRSRRCCVADGGRPGAVLVEENRGVERKASQQKHLLLDAAREAANVAVATAKRLYLRATISSVAAHGVVGSQCGWVASRTERMTHDVVFRGAPRRGKNTPPHPPTPHVE